MARARARGVPVPVVMEQVGSTQDVARVWAEEGKPAGVSVIALSQSAGRGRLGRAWVATDGALAMSIVLRPNVPTTRLGLLPLAAAVAVRAACSPSLRIKWPNDLLAPDGRKVAGLLAEAEISGGRVRHVVLGIGVNVSASPEGMLAASLAELGPAPDLGELAVDVVAELLDWTTRAFDAPDRVVAAWSEASATLGARVRVGGVEGVALDVAPDGSLRLRMDDGTLHRVVAGDVEAVREVRP